MFKIQTISVFIILQFCAINLNGHPLPRSADIPSSDTRVGIPTQDGQYKEYIDYIEEDVGASDGSPDERYEIINAEGSVSSSGANVPNAQVVDDVDLNQFDQNGNFIGAPVETVPAQQPYSGQQSYPNQQPYPGQQPYSGQQPIQQIQIKQIDAPQTVTASAEDQDYYEDEEEEEEEKETDLGQNSGVQKFLINSQKHQVEQFFKPVIKPPKRNPYTVIEEKYPGILKQIKSSSKQNTMKEKKFPLEENYQVQSKYPQTQDVKQETEYEYIEDDPEVIYDSNKDSDSSVQHMDTSIEQKDNSSEEKDSSVEEKVIPTEVEDNPFKKPLKSVERTTSVIENTESPVQYMDIQPVMNAQNPVVIQQLSGPNATDPGTVQITEQKVETHNSTLSTISAPDEKITVQAKYDDTVLKPKRKPRILARYKVIIPVIVPNLRIRVPYDKKESTN